MISASAPGKINLFFSVGRVRDDGYHDVYSVYQAIGLRDIVTIEISDQNSLFATSISNSWIRCQQIRAISVF
jgi:4-diphosphocytidyl-2-C-methyl-D-erythritol kinase